MKQKGDTLLKLIAIFGSLKEWAYKNNGIVLVTNQPESEFNKAPGHILRPFGIRVSLQLKKFGKLSKSQVILNLRRYLSERSDPGQWGIALL